MVTYFLSDIKGNASGAFIPKPSPWAVVPSRPVRSYVDGDGRFAAHHATPSPPSAVMKRRRSLMSDYRVLMSSTSSRAFPSFPHVEQNRIEEKVVAAEVATGSPLGGSPLGGSRLDVFHNNSERFNVRRTVSHLTAAAVSPGPEDSFMLKPLPLPSAPPAAPAGASGSHSQAQGRIELGGYPPQNPPAERGIGQTVGASRPMEPDRARGEVEEVATGAIG